MDQDTHPVSSTHHLPTPLASRPHIEGTKVALVVMVSLFFHNTLLIHVAGVGVPGIELIALAAGWGVFEHMNHRATPRVYALRFLRAFHTKSFLGACVFGLLCVYLSQTPPFLSSVRGLTILCWYYVLVVEDLKRSPPEPGSFPFLKRIGDET